MTYLVEICDNIEHDTPVIGAWTGGDLWRKGYGPFQNDEKALAELPGKMKIRLQQGFSLCSFSLYHYSDRHRIEYFLQREGETNMSKVENLEQIAKSAGLVR